MRKFLAILFSVVVTVGAITVLGASVSDPYEFDGDVITNPFWWLYTTEAQTEPTTSEANWVKVGEDATATYYYDAANMTVNEVVSIQQPGWSPEIGIYFNVPAGMTSVSVNGKTANVAAIDGAGAVVYLSALTQEVNTVVATYGDKTATVSFKKEAKPEETTEAPTTAAPVELKITGQPQNVTAKVSNTVTFKVTAQGEGLTYQWQVSSSNGERWGNTSLTGNKTSQLSLVVAENYDGRLYRCIVTDKNGKSVTSNAAKLSIETVVAALKITSQPKSVTVAAGQTASFNIVAEGEGLTYQWQLSASNGERWANTSLPGNKTSALTFVAPATYNGRLYRCIVTDAKGNTVTSDAAKLSIGGAQSTLKITSQPKSVTVAAGQTVSFNIVAEGEGLTYQWQLSASNGERWANTSLPGNKTSTLAFAAPATYNGRLYRCVVTDAKGNTVTSDAAKISIGGAQSTLKITSQPKSTAVAAGQAVSFKIVAEGEGLTYQWQLSASNGERWANTSLPGNNTSELAFAAPATYNGRLYRCVVTDAKGNTVTSEAAKLTIGSVDQPILITYQPKDVTVAAGSATSFNVAAQGEGLTYQWQVSSSNGERWGNTSLAGAKTQTLQLVAPATYNGRLYRCVITDAKGNTVTTNAAKLTVQ